LILAVVHVSTLLLFRKQEPSGPIFISIDDVFRGFALIEELVAPSGNVVEFKRSSCVILAKSPSCSLTVPLFSAEVMMLCRGMFASKESDVALLSARGSKVGAAVGAEEASPVVVEDKLTLVLLDVGLESVVVPFVSAVLVSPGEVDVLRVMLLIAGIDVLMLDGTDKVVPLVIGVSVALLIDDA
jgi:hypothetical protein